MFQTIVSFSKCHALYSPVVYQVQCQYTGKFSLYSHIFRCFSCPLLSSYYFQRQLPRHIRMFSRLLRNIQFICTFFLTLCFSMSGLNRVMRHIETSLLQKLLICSSAFEELDGVTKNASGYRHHFLSHSFTLHSESVSEAFNQIDLFCLWCSNTVFFLLSCYTSNSGSDYQVAKN